MQQTYARAGSLVAALSHGLAFPVAERPVRWSATDVRTAIERAPHHSTIRVPPGVFTFSEPLVLRTDNITVEGCGADTILRLADNVNCPLLVIGSTETTKDFRTPFVVRGITLKNLILDGNGDYQPHEVASGDISGGIEIRNNCLTIRGAEDVVVQNVITRNARSGGVVLEKYCRRVRISGLESYGNFFDGFAAYETYDSLFEGLHLHHNRAAGVSVDINFNNNTVRDSRFFDNGSQGVFMRWSRGNRFLNVEMSRNGEQGVFIARAENDGSDAVNNEFHEVTIAGSGREGFRVNDATCTGNVFRGQFRGNQHPNVIVQN